MTRSGSVNIPHCVICFREISANLKATQPLNPRKVFKVSSHFLRPEVFTKYSKWDFLNDLERESPFCTMCVTSGEKLTVLNDRLEELQREIISFVKYFAKEIIRNRPNDDNDSDEGQHHGQENTFHKVDDYNKGGKRITPTTPSNVAVAEKSSADIAILYDEDINPDPEVVVKEEYTEDQPYYLVSDDDCFKSPTTDEENDKNDTTFEPNGTRKRKRNSPNSQKLNPKKSSTTKIKNLRKRAQNEKPEWAETVVTEEHLINEWAIRQVNTTKDGCMSQYFTCREGGRQCPTRLLKKTGVEVGGVKYYTNGKPHEHKEKAGIPREVKTEIWKLLEEYPTAKPNFIIETLKATKGITISSAKLFNLLSYAKKLKSAGKTFTYHIPENHRSARSKQNSGTSDNPATGHVTVSDFMKEGQLLNG